MYNNTLYVGMDVHKETFSLCCYDMQQDRIFHVQRMEADYKQVLNYLNAVRKCYFVNADMIIRRSSYPSDLSESDIVSQLPEYVCRGGSCIIDPYGHYLTEPVWDQEAIIYAELDMSLPSSCKMEHDVVGHYARPDILELKINDK